ncbi:MAG: protein kinase domain-containing protein [Bryobacteraceae bacterium]
MCYPLVRRSVLALQLPARIGKYELEEYLGGGMSEVYRARDTVIGRTVAVKILTEAGCADADAKARFLQEARLAGNIQHDNVLSIYDFGEDERQRPYMVMEFLRGVDLRHAIRDGNLGSLQARLRIALQVSRALGYIHTLDIVHRDIKPENIHLTAAGVVKLMDFGIAKTQGLSMTRTGYVMGTPYYMAPEQVLGKNIGPAVDIYAFGVLFFELLTGARPVTGDTVERIFYSILNEPLDLTALRGNVPDPVCDLIASSTAKDAAQRPNFEAVAAEIERILTDIDAPARPLAPEPQPAPPPPPPVPARSRPATMKWMAVLLGIALLAATGVLVKLLLTPRHNVQPSPLPAAAAALPRTLSTPTGDMVLVPEGEFLFGKDKTPVKLPAFYIDKTEVTNAAYEKFCKQTGHAVPAEFPADKPDYPVVDVTIADARDFAAWAHKRLPTAQQWEKAARGAHGWLFPWGNDRNPTLANVLDNDSLGKHEIMRADSFQQGASPYGALNMVGNAWEFIDQTVTPEPANVNYFAKHLNPPPAPQELWYEIRGESFDDKLALRTARAFEYGGVWEDSAVPARWKDSKIGFRCVKDPIPAP